MNRMPVITLTTDFGERDYYVGSMRGVLLSLCPDANLVDITHQITPFSPLEGSFVLSQACPSFPAGTVHLAVVDPGVGGIRKALLVSSRDQFFVGPDNGLFTPFLGEDARIFRIRETNPDCSHTFHGRDLFAPVAARLARGEAPETLGEPTQQAVRLHIPRPRREENFVEGEILWTDRFGNLITNIHQRDLVRLEGNLDIRVGTYKIPRLSRTYDDGMMGESLALVGSSGYLELAVVQGNAGGQLGVGRGERVRIRSRESS